jgi:hypothetical protein
MVARVPIWMRQPFRHFKPDGIDATPSDVKRRELVSAIA